MYRSMIHDLLGDCDTWPAWHDVMTSLLMTLTSYIRTCIKIRMTQKDQRRMDAGTRLYTWINVFSACQRLCWCAVVRRIGLVRVSLRSTRKILAQSDVPFTTVTSVIRPYMLKVFTTVRILTNNWVGLFASYVTCLSYVAELSSNELLSIEWGGVKVYRVVKGEI